MLGSSDAYRRRRGCRVNFVYNIQCAYDYRVFLHRLCIRARIHDRAWLPPLSINVATKRIPLVDKYSVGICNWSVSDESYWSPG